MPGSDDLVNQGLVCMLCEGYISDTEETVKHMNFDVHAECLKSAQAKLPQTIKPASPGGCCGMCAAPVYESGMVIPNKSAFSLYIYGLYYKKLLQTDLALEFLKKAQAMAHRRGPAQLIRACDAAIDSMYGEGITR